MTKRIPFRFAPIPEALLFDKSVPSDVIRLWATLYRMADLAGRTEVNRADLAAALGWSERTVSRMASAAKERGYVEAQRAGFGRPNAYSVTLPDLAPMEAPSGAKSRTTVVPDQATLTSLLVREEITTEKENMPAAPASKPTAGYVAASTLAAFEAFWQDYPKPRRVDKRKAQETFAKAAKEGADIAAGLTRWIVFWKEAGTETQFIPWATTWLNQRRWETDPGPARPQQAPNGAKVGRRPNIITDRTAREGIE